MQWVEGDIDGLEIVLVDPYTDDRGWLIELFRSDETEPDLSPAMAYISLTHAGVTRGPHEHVIAQLRAGSGITQPRLNRVAHIST